MIDSVSYLNSLSYSTADNEKVGAPPKKELGKDDFMKLLVLQYQNQNPLEPMEDTEMIANMAQFSSLEQMQNVAKAMDTLALSQTSSTNAQMVSLVGKRVMAPGNMLTLKDGFGVDLKFNIPENTEKASLIIKNENGDIVYSDRDTTYNSGTHTFKFDAKDMDGNPLPDGQYTYQLVDEGGKKIESAKLFGNYFIDGVSFNGDNINLISKDTLIAIADVVEVKI